MREEDYLDDMHNGMEYYQTESRRYAFYPNFRNNPEYATLGLVGEAGEIANKVKKMQRDELTWQNIRSDIEAELGDVLWYMARMADEFGLDLGRIAAANLSKLEDRKTRGVLGGSGDNR